MKPLMDVDVRRWKSFLEGVSGDNIFQTPEMRDVFAGTKNYEPVVVAIEKDSEIRDLVLGCIIKEGEGLKGIFSSRAIVTGGPLSKEEDFKDILSVFDDAVRQKSLYSQIRNIRDMSAHRQSFEVIGYSWEEHLNFVHDLTRPPEMIFAEFSQGRQKGIKKAEERGIRFIEGGKSDVMGLHRLVAATYREVGVPLADASLFESAWRFLSPGEMVHIFNAVLNEELVASRIILSYRGILHDWYAGSTSSGREHNANEFLVWSIMRWGSENGFRSFDFGGAGKPGERYGPGEFKRRFGGILTNFGRFQKTYHPMKHFVGRTGYEVVKKIR